MLRRSSGSMTAASFSVTWSLLGMAAILGGAPRPPAFAQMKTGPEGPVFEGGEVLLLLREDVCAKQASPSAPTSRGGSG
jgi:hypothetical protein